MRPKKKVLLLAPDETTYAVQTHRLETWGLRVVTECEALLEGTEPDAILCDGASRAHIAQLAAEHPGVHFIVMAANDEQAMALGKDALDGTGRMVYTVHLLETHLLLREALRLALTRKRGPKPQPQPVTERHGTASAA